jgi:hypothetical protein
MEAASMEIQITTNAGVHELPSGAGPSVEPAAVRTTGRAAPVLAFALLCVIFAAPLVDAQSATDPPVGGEAIADAPTWDAAAPWRACETALPWFHASELPDFEPLLTELVGQGRLEPFSREWIAAAQAEAPPFDDVLAAAAEARKLVLWYVPALEGQHMILTHLLDRYMLTGPLSHPALIGVVGEAYIPLKLPAGGELARRFGLHAPDVLEPALLVLSPEGEVLHQMDRIATFDGELVAAWLAAIARDQREFLGWPEGLVQGAEVDDPGQALSDASRWLDAGQPDLARASLSEIPDGASRAHLAWRDLLAARVAFLERDAEATLRLADVAMMRSHRVRDLTGSAPSVVRGVALLRSGRLQEAEWTLRGAQRADEAARSKPSLPSIDVGFVDFDRRHGPLAAEAGFHLGYALMHQGREDEAVAVWRGVVSAYPDSLHAARASAACELGSDGYRGESARARGLVDPRWLPDAAYAPQRDSRRGRDVDDAEELARWGLSFLALTQRQDGAWNGPRWGGDGTGRIQPREERGTFHNIDTAIAAVAASALHQWRHLLPGAAAARDRAEAFLLRDDLVQRGATTAWAYADALRLEHFAQRLPELHGDQAARVREAMARWIEELLLQQEELDGPFAHYVYTSTFVTARVLLSLERARDAGLAVDPTVFERAADVLAAARDPQSGLFGYLLDHPTVGRNLAGASARQPLCVLALRAAGREHDDALPTAVATFLEGYERSTERARLANFHIPSLGQTAGYFFFHDLYPATLAAREVPGEEGVALRRSLLEAVCALPEADGGFLDSGFSYGKAYGTAMALLCLDVLTLR